MAVTVKKKATGEVSVQKKAKGVVLLENTLPMNLETPVFTEQGGEPTTLPGVPGDVQGSMQTTVMEAQQIMPFCEIGFEASYTHNLGNYESTRVNVSIKIPCLHGEIDEAFTYAKEWVDQKLNAVVAEVKGA